MQEYEVVKKQSEAKLAAHKCVLACVQCVCCMCPDEYEARKYEGKWAGKQAASNEITSQDRNQVMQA